MDWYGSGQSGGIGGNFQPWVRVILDTDMSSDPGDAGALRTLHSLADLGLVSILGVMCAGTFLYSPGCCDAMNRFSGRPNIPIGVNKGPTLEPGPDPYVYNQYIATNFPNRYPSNDNSLVPDAIQQYLDILTGMPDQSVIVCAIGQLANLAHVYGFPAGKALYDAKVLATVIMGGDYPTGNEYNFYTDPGSAEFFVNNNTGRMVFGGFTIGLGIKTGQTVINNGILSDPLYWAYNLFKIANPTLVPRESWDQLGVLRAVFGTAILGTTWFSDVGVGSNVVASDGTNAWTATPVKDQTYEGLIQSNNTFAAKIDQLMTEQPAI